VGLIKKRGKETRALKCSRAGSSKVGGEVGKKDFIEKDDRRGNRKKKRERKREKRIVT